METNHRLDAKAKRLRNRQRNLVAKDHKPKAHYHKPKTQYKREKFDPQSHSQEG